MVARYAIGVGLGALVTFALFFLMQAIIATNEANLDEGVTFRQKFLSKILSLR